MKRTDSLAINLACVAAVVGFSTAAWGGTSQVWKDITVSGSWADGAMWNSGTAPTAGSTNSFASSTTLTGVTTVTIPAAGVGPVYLAGSAFAFPCSGGELLFKGEGDVPPVFDVENFLTDYLGYGWVALENVVFDLTDVTHRLIVEGKCRSTWRLGKGATLRYPSYDILLAGDNAAGSRLVLESGSVCTNGNLNIGRGSATWGAVVMRGGEFRPSAALLGINSDSIGVLEMFGGSFVLKNDNLRLGHNPETAGAVYVHDGASLVLGGNIHVGESGRGEFFADGGTVTVANALFVLNRSSDSTEPGERDGVVTVAGTGRLSFGVFQEYNGQSSHTCKSSILLNLRENGEMVVGSGTSLARHLNPTTGYVRLSFDGGTITRLTDSPDGEVALATFRGIDTVLYKGGTRLRARTTAGAATKLHLSSCAFRAPLGQGVRSIAVTDGGAGYFMPPFVTISGGSGSNATAIAQVDYEAMTVTNLIVTCAGEGYAADDELTVTFRAASGDAAKPTAVATAACTLAANETGPLTIADDTTFTVDADVSIPGDLVIDGNSVVDLPANLTVGGDVILTGVGRLRVAGNAVVAGSVRAPKGSVLFIGSGSTVGGNVTAAVYELGDEAVTGAFERVGANLRLGGPAASETILRTTSAHAFGTLSLGAGKVQIFPGAALSFTSLAERDAGALLYWNDDEATKPTFGTKPACIGSSGLLPGGLAANGKGEVTGQLLAWNGTDQTFAATAAGTEGSLSVGAGTTTVADDTVVESGLVVGSANAGKILDGGTLTSGNGKDLVILDMKVSSDIRNSYSPTLTLKTKIVDESAQKPTTLVLAGYKDVPKASCEVTGKTFPSFELANAQNAYSGGTHLRDCCVRAVSDACFGAVPATTCTNISVTGTSILKGYQWTVHPLELAATRGLHIAAGAVLLTYESGGSLSAYDEKISVRVDGPLTGRGLITSGPWAGGGTRYVLDLAGDLSRFEGTISCMGQVRVRDMSQIGEKARIHFWGQTGGITNANDTTSKGVSQLEGYGTLDKTVGYQEGGVVCCSLQTFAPDTEGRDMSNFGPGGFAAVGGPLTVSLRPPAGSARLVWTDSNGKGTPGFLGKDGQLNLQNEASTHVLTWTTDVDINSSVGLTWSNPFQRQLMIGRRNADAVVKWTGDLTNNSKGNFSVVGCGTLFFAGSAHVTSGVYLYSRSASVGADTDARVVIDAPLDFSLNMRPEAAFVMRSESGTGACELNHESNILQVVRVESGTLEVNGGTSATNLTVGAAGTLAGSGALAVTGDARIDGTLAVDANRTAPLLTVDGDVAFGVASQVAAIDPAELSKATDVTVMTWTGVSSGCPAVSPVRALQKWRPRVIGQALHYRYEPNGTILIVQ